MSLSSMASLAVQRRPDFGPTVLPQTSFKGISAATGTELPDTATSKSAPSAESTTETNVTAAIKVIAAYVPTEILTLYVAVLAAMPTTAPTTGTAAASSSALTVFWAFFVATPLTVWTLFAVKVKSGGGGLPKALSAWPKWEMFAATLCYAAWAGALPGSPLVGGGYTHEISGIMVLVVATTLGLVAPLFQTPLPAPK